MELTDIRGTPLDPAMSAGKWKDKVPGGIVLFLGKKSFTSVEGERALGKGGATVPVPQPEDTACEEQLMVSHCGRLGVGFSSVALGL